MSRAKTWRNLILGIVIALVALYLTYQRADLPALVEILSDASIPMLLLVIPFLACSYLFRIARWKVLLAPVSEVSFGQITGPLLTGFAVNSLLPGRVGELLRALMLSRKSRIPRASCFATVVLARLFDGLTLTAFTLGLLLTGWNSMGETTRLGLIGAGLLYIGVLAGLVSLRIWSEKAARAMSAPVKLLSSKLGDRLQSLLLSFSRGLAVLQSGREVVTVAALSAGVWLSLVVSVVPAFASLGLSLRWSYPFLVLVLAAFGMLIPTPAGTGTVHYAIGVVMPTMTAIGPTDAKALAIVFHATQFLPIIVAGLLGAAREGVGARDMERMAERAEAGPDR